MEKELQEKIRPKSVPPTSPVKERQGIHPSRLRGFLVPSTETRIGFGLSAFQ